MKRPAKEASDEEWAQYLVQKDPGTMMEMADSLSLTRLLIAKGVFTYDELVAERSMALGLALSSMIDVHREMDDITALSKDPAQVVSEAIGPVVEEYLRNGFDDA